MTIIKIISKTGFSLLPLIINPFLFLFIAAIKFYKYGLWKSEIILAPLGIALIFFNRKYGVEWAEGSSDDIPNYIFMYLTDQILSPLEIVNRYLDSPGQNEPLWHLIAWISSNVIGLTPSNFIFFQYFIIIYFIFISSYFISKKYFIYIIFSYFFLSITSLDSITFIWRQQLAFTTFLAGMGLYFFSANQKSGIALILMSCLFHNSMILFMAIFFEYNLLNLRISYKIIINIIGCIFILPISIVLMEYIGMDFVRSYFEDSSPNLIGTYINISVSSFLIILSLLKLKSDDFNKIIALISITIYTICIVFPSASGVYIRYLMFSYPLVAIYFIRVYLLNFKANIPIIISLIFISGLGRIGYHIYSDFGVTRYLAYGGLLDPSMGIIKSLILFFNSTGIEGL